jgi:hypothetical protein
MLPLAAGGNGSSDAARAFSSEAKGFAPGRASNQKPEAPFRFDRNGFDSIAAEKALGNIQQVKVRQQVHGEIAAKGSVAVAAVTTDAGDLDCALIELDVVALMGLSC